MIVMHETFGVTFLFFSEDPSDVELPILADSEI